MVLNGAYGRSLAFGPGYAESSAWPGSAGTTIVSGHRDTHFRFLQLLEEGDEIFLEDSTGHHFGYRVQDRRISSERGGHIVLGRHDPALVLVTCYPFDSLVSGGPLRYVVTADFEGEVGAVKQRRQFE